MTTNKLYSACSEQLWPVFVDYGRQNCRYCNDELFIQAASEEEAQQKVLAFIEELRPDYPEEIGNKQFGFDDKAMDKYYISIAPMEEDYLII